MAKDPSDPKNDREQITTNKVLGQMLQEGKKSSKNQEVRNDALAARDAAQAKVDILKANGDKKAAAKMSKDLKAIEDVMAKGGGPAAQKNRLDELVELGKQADLAIDNSNLEFKKVEEQKKAQSEVLEATIKNDPTQQSLADLTARIEKDNKAILRDTNFNSLKSDKAMEKFSRASLFGDDKFREELGQAYKEGQKELAAALAIESEKERDLAVALAEKNLETIAEGVESEEKRTEAAKEQQKANSNLHQIGQQLIDNGEKLEKFASGAMKAGGIFAGFAAIAMWFIDPEKMRDIMIKLFDDIMGIFDSIKLLLEGNFTGFMKEMEGHWVTFGVILGVLAMVLLPKIMIALGGGLQAMNTLLTAVSTFKHFMLFNFIPTMITNLGAIGVSMGFAAGSLASVLVPVILIIGALSLLYIGFKKLKESLGPGASIMDTLKVAMLYFVDFLAMIVNGITFIPRKIIGFLGPKLLKWIMGDDFDTSFIDNIAGGLDTDRGAKAAEEIRLKNEQAAAEKAAEEEAEGKSKKDLDPADMTPEQIAALANDPSAGVDLENLTDTNLDLQAANKGSSDTVLSAQTQNTSNNQNITNQTMFTPSLSKFMMDSLATR